MNQVWMTELYRLKYINKYLEIYIVLLGFVVILILKHDQYEKIIFFFVLSFVLAGFNQEERFVEQSDTKLIESTSIIKENPYGTTPYAFGG